MADVLTPQQRSYCMSRIKGKDTSIEVTIRSMLHRNGWRFRKHASNLPGRPDIVFRKLKIAIFIDGDFWHGRRFSKWQHKLTPKWQEKIEGNIKRDRRNIHNLKNDGWAVLRVWEGDIEKNLAGAVARIESFLAKEHEGIQH